MVVTINTGKGDNAVISKKEKNWSKISKNPQKINYSQEILPKPDWLKIKVSNSSAVAKTKELLRKYNLHSVCEEASCPNLNECFGNKVATFMIMGDMCTRRCSFCDVAHGRPEPLDANEPRRLAEALQHLNLNFIVITSVDRDDLKDGGANHFSECIYEIRKLMPNMGIEILVPDFRKRGDIALQALSKNLPDVFNHNIETVPRLYKISRPGASYTWSLELLSKFKDMHPKIPTKSGIMLGLGETFDEIMQVLEDLRQHKVDMLTVGQYLSPSPAHMPVARYYTPQEFIDIGKAATDMGFTKVASAPLVRSSYHAEQQLYSK